MKKIVLISVVFSMMAALFSCDQDTPVPYTKVKFTVNIYANNLVHIGGYEYFTGGISGIVVYRADMNTFYAYDRACAYDWDYLGRVEMDTAGGLYLIDYHCGSTYNILNGYPIAGHAKQPLRSYNAQLISDTYLQVSN